MAAHLDSKAMLRRLIGFDTTSRESNLALIDFVRDYLDGYGVASDLSFDEDGRKANLFATIGRPAPGGLVLSGHTDVVPVDGQRWSSEPFDLAERDGRLYGRGAADMKGFIAVALSKVPDFVERRDRAAAPVHLAFTFDEEVGCLGVQTLLADLKAREIRPAGCVIGEPTLMKPVTGHKGKRSVHCHVHGLESHSALAHEGVNAVEAAAELIAFLKGLARRFRDHGPYDRDFTPPYTTVHTGKIQGGTALNIVPKACSFDFEFRHLPSQDPDALMAEIRRFAEEKLLPEMRAVHEETGFEFDEYSTLAGLDTKDDEEIVRLVLETTGANGTGKVSYGTEGGFYQQSGIPTVICGPGSIEQAHKPDEWVALEQVALCERFIDRLAAKAAGGHGTSP